MVQRLLNGYLGGVIDEPIFKEKSAALKIEEAELAEMLAGGGGEGWGAEMGKWAVSAFDFSQQALEMWHGSNIAGRRGILDCLCSNRTLTDAILVLTRRKPFDILVEDPFLKNGTPEGNRTPTYSSGGHRPDSCNQLNFNKVTSFSKMLGGLIGAQVDRTHRNVPENPAQTFETNELAQLVTAWPNLPGRVRAAIRLLAGLDAPGADA